MRSRPSFHGRKIGTIAHLTCFSFYVTKNVVTVEGGMVTADDAELAKKPKMYALHGVSHDTWKRFSDEGYRHYLVLMPGFKYNMTDLQAALGVHQLPRVFEGARRRQAIWERYDVAFADLPLVRPAPVEAGTIHARQTRRRSGPGRAVRSEGTSRRPPRSGVAVSRRWPRRSGVGIGRPSSERARDPPNHGLDVFVRQAGRQRQRDGPLTDPRRVGEVLGTMPESLGVVGL
jgi:hypothetical protein